MAGIGHPNKDIAGRRYTTSEKAYLKSAKAEHLTKKALSSGKASDHFEAQKAHQAAASAHGKASSASLSGPHAGELGPHDAARTYHSAAAVSHGVQGRAAAGALKNRDVGYFQELKSSRQGSTALRRHLTITRHSGGGRLRMRKMGPGQQHGEGGRFVGVPGGAK